MKSSFGIGPAGNKQFGAFCFRTSGGFERGVVQASEGLRSASLPADDDAAQIRTRLGRLVEETVDASRKRLSSADTARNEYILSRSRPSPGDRRAAGKAIKPGSTL